MYSGQGFQYCDLLLEQGYTAEVMDRATYALEGAKQHGAQLLQTAINQLSLGRTRHTQNDLQSARNWLDKATAGLREAGLQDYLIRGLLARAALYRDTQKFSLAHQDLAEVYEIAEPSGMRLFITDYHLEMARLLLASGEADKTPKHIKTAETLINQTGYHRRDQELADLKNQLTH